MHIAYVVGAYPQPSETFIINEIEGLRRRGCRVEIFSLFVPPGGPAEGVTYGWSAAPARLRRKVRPQAAVRALAAEWQHSFAALGVQAVMAHFGSLPSTVAMAAAGELPWVLSLHARDIYVEAERLPEKVTLAAAVVTCTAANLAYLRAQFPTAADRFHLIYHGLPTEWLNMPPPLPRDNAPLRLLAVGRLVEKKGFLTLLEACAHLLKLGVSFTLCLAGDGPQRSLLAKRCREPCLRNLVNFTGWLSPEELRSAYNSADLLCCPSIIAADGDRDGLPNVLLEAMACGLPVVGSRFSGIPEAIVDGETGLLVPPGDVEALAAAIAGLQDPLLRARLGRVANARVRTHFDGEEWLGRLLALLEGLQ